MAKRENDEELAPWPILLFGLWFTSLVCFLFLLVLLSPVIAFFLGGE